MKKHSYKFTYIIGYRNTTPERLQNLKFVLSWLAGFSDTEIIIIEQDNYPKINNLNLPAKYHFIENSGPYNRSWAFNVGTKYATTDIIGYGDSDLIMNPEEFIKGIYMLNTYDCVSPYSKVIDLLPNEKTIDFNFLSTINRPGRGEENHQKINLTGGIVFFRKQAIDKIGGWPEEFEGWGAEDNAMTIKVNLLLTSHEYTATCYHLHHEIVVPNEMEYKRNLQILQQMTTLSKEQIMFIISKTAINSGSVNKYKRFFEYVH